MNKDIWRTLTLCLILLLGTIHISAQSKPADGLVFSLDATQSVPRETIKGLPVEKIDEGSNTAYQAASDYIITDLSSGQAVNIAARLQQYTQLPVLTIDGENTVEDGYWAYYLDEDSLQQTILQLFYQEI